MTTRSLRYTFELDFWTVLRHHGRMNYKSDANHLIGFLHDELLDNYMVVHDEYSDLCHEGKYDGVLESPVIFGEMGRDSMGRMLFG